MSSNERTRVQLSLGEADRTSSRH